MAEQLASGWWRCDCERKCGCAGNRKKLQPPVLERCPDCDVRRPDTYSEALMSMTREERRAEKMRRWRARQSVG